MSSALRALQSEMVTKLAGIAEFSGASIVPLSRLKGDVENDIQHALRTLGISVFVMPPEPRASKPTVPGPHFDETMLGVAIFENPTINETGIDAWDAWELIVRELHQWKPADDRFGTVYVRPDPWEDDPQAAGRAFFAYFNCRTNLTITPDP